MIASELRKHLELRMQLQTRGSRRLRGVFLEPLRFRSQKMIAKLFVAPDFSETISGNSTAHWLSYPAV